MDKWEIINVKHKNVVKWLNEIEMVRTYYLSSCALLNIKMNILTEFL